jgi:hypothetical protein
MKLDWKRYIVVAGKLLLAGIGGAIVGLPVAFVLALVFGLVFGLISPDLGMLAAGLAYLIAWPLILLVEAAICAHVWKWK